MTESQALGRDEQTLALRLRALKTAREHVAELYAVKNDKGYPRFSGNVSDVLKEEMRVAEFILGDGQFS